MVFEISERIFFLLFISRTLFILKYYSLSSTIHSRVLFISRILFLLKYYLSHRALFILEHYILSECTHTTHVAIYPGCSDLLDI